MDLVQRKLTRDEWNSIEVPISIEEKKIIKLIIDGYTDINLVENYNDSLMTYIKIPYSENMENHLYNVYFKKLIEEHVKKYKLDYDCIISNSQSTIIKKIDSLRLEKNTTKLMKEMKEDLFDYLLIVIIGKLLKYKKINNSKWNYYYYTLYKIKNYKVKLVNKKVIEYVNYILDLYEKDIDILDMINNSYNYIEKNECIYVLGNIELYNHQKQLFSIFKTQKEERNKNDEREEHEKYNESKLVLYIAPTATGKTLSPIGLSEGHRIIFVCAARHVGMSLAKSAISMGKKIALAFGCDSSQDIRLHYFAASKYFKHEKKDADMFKSNNYFCVCGRKNCTKIGEDIKYKDGTKKVDNSVGDKVDIMISDVQSYTCAMYYMCAFNEKENIITYWDEPTITMDYESHPCHDIISKNWRENIIPNMVLSSATLPKEEEITPVMMDFRSKFMNARVHSVISHDCKKSIPILNKNGYIELPHFMAESYTQLMECVEHCKNYLTVLRYFDLYETSRFIVYICNDMETYLKDTRYDFDEYFGSLDDVNMGQIKNYYLLLLGHIKPEKFSELRNYFITTRKYKIKPNDKAVETEFKKSHSVEQHTPQSSDSKELVRTQSVQLPVSKKTVTQNGALISTRDAHTITDGPAIFIAQDVDKIGKFCIQQANIPESKMKLIAETIVKNNVIKDKILTLEKSIDDATASFQDKDNKASSDTRLPPNVKKMMSEIENLYKFVKSVTLDDVFVPNKKAHLKKWVSDELYKDSLPYTSDIYDNDVEKIMMIDDIENIWKVLLLLGIGLFSQTKCIAYTEIVKRLASEQKLYLIIANGDYIYGTNYQFCHGFIGKDVEQMTQEKAIQAFGRIGRNKLQQTYTVRLRDDNLIKKVFLKEEDKIEVHNMNMLFSS